MVERPISPEFLARLIGGEIERVEGDPRGPFSPSDNEDDDGVPPVSNAVATSTPDLTGLTDRELLALYVQVLDNLRVRGTVRSTNNPVADHAEGLCARALNLQLASKSTTGYDAIDPSGHKIEIKARRITEHNPSRQISAIRGLTHKHFDLLAGILFNAVFSANVLIGCFASILFVCAPQSHAQEIKELPSDAAISGKQPAIYWHDKDAQFDLDASTNQWSIAIRQDGNPPTRVPLPAYINQVYSIRRAAANHLVALAQCEAGAYYVGVMNAATSSVVDEILTSAAPGVSPDNRYIMLVRFYSMHGGEGEDDQYRLYDVLGNQAANWPHRPAQPAPEGQPKNYDGSLAGVAVYPLDPGVRERDNTFIEEGLEHRLASPFVWDHESRRVVFADYSSGVLSLIMVAVPSGGERYPETSVYQVPANRNPCAEVCLQKNIGKLEWLGNSVRVQLTTTPKNAPNRTSNLSVLVSSFIPAQR